MRRWFTLIEMTIVVVVIWVLAASLLPKLTSGMTKAENAWAFKDVNDIVTALEMYKIDNGNTYPVSVSCNWTIKTECTLSWVYTQLSPYLRSIPKGNTKLPQWTIGKWNIVPAWNAYGYIGTGQRYILSYQFIDTRDGQRYKAVRMPDEKRWMAENLNYKTANSVCYDNIETNCTNWFGRLYNWNEAQTVCPPDRHLASDDEWTIMLNKVEELYDGTQNHNLFSPTVPGSKTAKHLMFVQSDSFGFSAMTAGGWIWWGVFHGTGMYGMYWSSSQNAWNGINRMFVAWGIWVNHETDWKDRKRALRCIKN